MPPRPRPWFRFYAEAADSLKVHDLPDKLVKPWLIMLCLACTNTPRGRLPSAEKVAFKLRVKEEKAKAFIAELVTRHFIDFSDGHYVMHEWDDWQKDRDVAPSIRADKSRVNHANRDDSVTRITLEEEEEKEIEKEGEKDKEADAESAGAPPPVHRLFERCFGRLLSPMELEQVNALMEEHPYERIEYGLREAAELNKRSVRYVKAVCEGQANGHTNGSYGGKQATRPDPVGVAGGVSDLERRRAFVAQRGRESAE